MLSQDEAGKVVYASSFSKTVCPGIRVGYLVGPAALIKQVQGVATNTYISPNMVAQSIVNQFARSGRMESAVETVKNALRERRDLLVEALDEHLPEARFEPPSGGYFMWVELPEEVDVAELEAAAKERGVVFVKGDGLPARGRRERAAAGVLRRDAGPDRRGRQAPGRRRALARRHGVRTSKSGDDVDGVVLDLVAGEADGAPALRERLGVAAPILVKRDRVVVRAAAVGFDDQAELGVDEVAALAEEPAFAEPLGEPGLADELQRASPPAVTRCRRCGRSGRRRPHSPSRVVSGWAGVAPAWCCRPVTRSPRTFNCAGKGEVVRNRSVLVSRLLVALTRRIGSGCGSRSFRAQAAVAASRSARGTASCAAHRRPSSERRGVPDRVHGVMAAVETARIEAARNRGRGEAGIDQLAGGDRAVLERSDASDFLVRGTKFPRGGHFVPGHAPRLARQRRRRRYQRSFIAPSLHNRHERHGLVAVTIHVEDGPYSVPSSRTKSARAVSRSARICGIAWSARSPSSRTTSAPGPARG